MSEPTIKKTTDYSQFNFMAGNRKIDNGHVKYLEKEMQYNPQLFAAQPMLVNEHMFIVDGQHRFHAAQNLGLPVYYIVQNGLTIEATRHLNVAQKGWTIIDFAQSYADSGRKDYIDFLRIHRKFPRINISIKILYLQGRGLHRGDADFRAGGFKINDIDAATEWLEKIDELQYLTGLKFNTPMAAAFMKLFRDEESEFSYDKFLTRLQRENARTAFELHSTVRNSLRAIEDVYNYQSNTRTRLY